MFAYMCFNYNVPICVLEEIFVNKADEYYVGNLPNYRIGMEARTYLAQTDPNM